MNMAKIQKVEKSIVEFNAHQNPRIWPDKGMKRYQNVLNYHEKPILTSETICVMKKKKFSIPRKFVSKILRISAIFNLSGFCQKACEIGQKVCSLKWKSWSTRCKSLRRDILKFVSLVKCRTWISRKCQ